MPLLELRGSKRGWGGGSGAPLENLNFVNLHRKITKNVLQTSPSPWQTSIIYTCISITTHTPREKFSETVHARSYIFKACI